MKLLGFVITALVFSANVLVAGTITVDDGSQLGSSTLLGYGNGGARPAQTFTFSQFTPCPGCTLLSVELDVSDTIMNTYSFDPTDTGTFVITTSGAVQVGLPSGVQVGTILSNTAPNTSINLPVDSAIYNAANVNPPTTNIIGGQTIPGSSPSSVAPVGSSSQSSQVVYNYDGSVSTLLSATGGTGTATVDLSSFYGVGTFTISAAGQFNGGVTGPGDQDTSNAAYGQESVDVLFTESTPEPSTMVLFGSALLGIGFFARKRVKR